MREDRVVGRGDALIGRERELDALRSRLDAIRTDGGVGGGRLVVCAGEPGIGKTRLAQELAGVALANGVAVAWGRCLEGEGAPSFWPWRQVLRSLHVDPDVVLGGDADSPEDRFRLFEDVAGVLRDVAQPNGLVVILDDAHWADEPSLHVLRHLADHLDGSRLLVLVTFRDTEPAEGARRVLAELTRPTAERVALPRFDLAEVTAQLVQLTAGDPAVVSEAASVLAVTDGNPLFVREVGRAVADGTWRRDRPPRTVLDVVAARLDRVSPGCRRFVQAGAIVGRDLPLALVAAVLDQPVTECLPLVDEATAAGLLEQIGDAGVLRFVHALTRDAVDASLTTGDRVDLHRRVAEALEAQHADDLHDHVADIALHWAALAPYGEADVARTWMLRAAEEAVRRLAYEDGVRRYRAALDLPAPPLADLARCGVLLDLARAASLAGDVRGCADAASAAAVAARPTGDAELLADAALVVEAVPDPDVNAVAKQLCEQALAALGDDGHEPLRARLLAQRSHLAFYDGEHDRVSALSATALQLARAAGDDRALHDALRARQEACPGPDGRAEREQLAAELLAVARRTDSPRAAMWGHLWRIETLLECGRMAAAGEELAELRMAVDRLGGPVSGWHLDRVTACVAQAQGRYAEAAIVARRGFERLRQFEPAPATGAFSAMRCALARHVGVTEDAVAFAQGPFVSPPRFTTMARLTRAYLLVRAGLRDEATAWLQRAGPIDAWALPAFFVLPGYVYAALVTAELDRRDDLAAVLDRLEPFRGEHAVGNGVAYLGPAELALGRGAAALGRLDAAVTDLATAVELADRAGAPGFLAEAKYHLAGALAARRGAGDLERAVAMAKDADRLARALAMTAYTELTGALVAQLAGGTPGGLSRREEEVAALVAAGLTNRQIAERLYISERTAQNHVQHILTKLGFTTRSQIAAWATRRG